MLIRENNTISTREMANENMRTFEEMEYAEYQRVTKARGSPSHRFYPKGGHWEINESAIEISDDRLGEKSVDGWVKSWVKNPMNGWVKSWVKTERPSYAVSPKILPYRRTDWRNC